MTGPVTQSAYQPDFAHQAEHLCRLGATDANLAAALRTDADTIAQWLTTRPDFAQAVANGQAAANAAVTAALFRRACGFEQRLSRLVREDGKMVAKTYTREVPPDRQACVYWLQHRCPDLWGTGRRRARDLQDRADTTRASMAARDAVNAAPPMPAPPCALQEPSASSASPLPIAPPLSSTAPAPMASPVVPAKARRAAWRDLACTASTFASEARSLDVACPERSRGAALCAAPLGTTKDLLSAIALSPAYLTGDRRSARQHLLSATSSVAIEAGLRGHDYRL